MVILGVDVAGKRTSVEVAVGTAVEASTQELERPFIDTIVVGGCWLKAGTNTK